MANPNPIPSPETQFTKGQIVPGRGVTVGARTQAVTIQRLILERCGNPKCTDTALALLARSWCLVQEAKRILDGKPLPGQYRPDLDPVSLARALRRHRSRAVLELEPAQMIDPEDRTEPKTATAKPTAETTPTPAAGKPQSTEAEAEAIEVETEPELETGDENG